MTDLLRFQTAAGNVVVEVDEDEPGFDRVARSGIVSDARKAFETSLQEVHDAVAAGLRIFRGGALKPDGVVIEFGVRFNAEAGAVIAKTAVEGHLTVKLSWHKDAAIDQTVEAA